MMTALTTITPSAQAHSVAAQAPQARREPTRFGIVSYNVHKRLPKDIAVRDLQSLGARDDVDVMGLQELNRYPGITDRIGKDWKAAHGINAGRELVIVFRRSEFTLLKVRTFMMHRNLAYYSRFRFPARATLKAVLLHRASGAKVTVFNTHLNAHIEANHRYPGKWRVTPNAEMSKQHLQRMQRLWQRAHGPWVFVTGDFNFDAIADEKRRVAGGPWDTFHKLGTSSYAALGPTVRPTSPEGGRRIDYVWADNRLLDAGAVQFVNHSALDHYHSDHRPLLAKLDVDFAAEVAARPGP